MTAHCRPEVFWLGDDIQAVPVVTYGQRASDSPAARQYLFVPPFAEEMNRCRRLLSLIARGLAARGHFAALFDLPGTGDSPLPFADAHLPDWIAAVRSMIAHLGTARPLTVVGLRFGACLAQLAVSDTDPAPEMFAIAPISNGPAALRPYLRMAGQTEHGAAVTAGGYMFNPALVADLTALHLSLGGMTELVFLDGPRPWLQIEPDDPSALADVLIQQLNPAK